MARHLVLLVEDFSTEAFLAGLLPDMLPDGCTSEIHAFQGKQDLLGKLEARLRGYGRWLPADWRLVVLVDQDNDDCRGLKAQMEQAAERAALRSRSRDRERWKVVNRIAIEELEAWYFGDWEAVRAAYPRVGTTLPRQARYRNPDAIRGGTWEAFERVPQRRGYFKTGLRKVEAARAVAEHFDPGRNRSRSFARFHDVITEATE